LLWKYFEKGGPIMYFILACSVLALMIIIERFIYIAKVKRESAKIFDDTLKYLEKNDIAGALRVCEKYPDSIPANIIKTAIINKEKPWKQIREAIDDAGTRELPRIERFLPSLGTIISIAPMLGLLGTVVGMIKSSNVLAKAGITDSAELLGGIATALLTTAFGLIVAIPTLIVYNYLLHKSQDTIREISEKSDKVVLMLLEE
jgi:biopolymer transport protein ExbB